MLRKVNDDKDSYTRLKVTTMIGVNGMNATNTMEPITPCLAMRAREAAKAIGVSGRTLWQWTEDGYVPHVRRGKVVLYPVDALKDWLQQQARNSVHIEDGEKKSQNNTCTMDM